MGAEQKIFDEALGKKAGAERAAFLDHACGGDAALRARVERLLAAYEQAGSFLESPPTAALGETASPLVERPGVQVGPYKLLEQIGEGGMGVVFMAEQQRPVRRRVALKIIKAGMDTRQVVARFEAERQALAMMDHPNIAKVLDAGSTETGRPYVVMELVRGTPITEYCDHHHLTPRQRLELFVQVCQAVQHAHQKGIIHRDLKPSNVLVTVLDGIPVPKVIDFGIAKATGGQPLTDRTLFTRFAEMIGTPLYMSPEQAEMNSGADADTRSDVYSLGVLLYELLTGTTPFDKARLGKAAYDEVRRIIREEEPPRPSTRLSTLGERLSTVSANRKTEPRRLGQMVAGELDWIVMKALEKDRNRRYETANGLAKDVQRYLHDEPVFACPPTSAYRFRKLLRRHKKKAAIAGAIAAALVLGIFGTSIGMVRALAAEKLAQERKTAVERALGDATTAQQRAERKAAVTDTVNAFMRGVLSSAQPTSIHRADDVRLLDVLDSAVDNLATNLNDQPEAEAQVRATLGDTYRALGVTGEANTQLSRAYAAAVKAEGEESELALGIAQQWAFVLKQFNPGEAATLARKAYEIGKRRFGAGDPRLLHYEQTVAMTHQRPEDSAALYRELIRKAKDQGARTGFLATLHHNGAMALHQQGLFEEAEEFQKEAIRLGEETAGDDVINVGRRYQLYARIVQARGKRAEARAAFEKALAFQQEKLGRPHADAVNTLMLYEEFLEETGEYRAALAKVQEFLEIRRTQERQEDSSYLYGLTKVADLQLRLGADEEAVRTINRVMSSAQVRMGTVPPEWVESWEKMLLAVGLGGDKEWKSTTLRSNVWSALDAHLMANPGGADMLADAVAWDKLRFRLERWDATSTGSSDRPRLVPVGEGTFQELRGLAEPAPGIYRLSLEILRPFSKDVQQAQTWLLFTPWEVDLYRPPDHKLLKGAPAEHRQMSSLVLVSDDGGLQPPNGPGGTRENYALEASSSVDLPVGRYQFLTTSDDGMRLYVDDCLVVDAWLDRPPSRDEVVLDLSAGVHLLRAKFFNGARGAQLWLQIKPTDEPPTTPLPVAGKNNLAQRAGPRPLADLEARLGAEVKRRPNTVQPLAVRAGFYAKRGRFGEAAADYAAALRLDPSDYFLWVHAMAVTAGAGDVEAYRRQCREIVNRFGDSTDRVACERIVKACLFVPDAVPDLKPLIALADRAVAPGDPGSEDDQAWRALAKGMVEYRAGNIDASAEWLAKSVPPKPVTLLPRLRTTIGSFFLAMAEFRRGRSAEADAALKRGTEILERDGPRDGIFDEYFRDWILALHARREAAALLGRPLPPPTTQIVEPPAPSAAEGLNDVDKDRLFRLTTDISRNPSEAVLWQQRAEFLGNRGKFEAAIADFDKVLAAGGVDHWSWFMAIPAYVQTGDVEKYRRYCAAMQRWFEDSTDRTTCERVIRTCSMLPGALPDMRLLRELAERAVAPEVQEDPNQRLWRSLSRGMFEYRLGNFDEAARWLAGPAEVENRGSGRHISRQALALCFLAMVEHQRGRIDQARSLLGRGSQILASDAPNGNNWFPFYDWVTALEVRRQAEELLSRSAPPTTHPVPVATTQAIDPLPPSAADGLGEADRARLSRLTADILENATESAWVERATFLGNRGRFELAAKDFQKALASGLGDPHGWFNAATVYVRMGNKDEYRRLCAEVLRRYDDSTDRNLCEHVAKTCAILPGAVADMQALGKVADQAAAPQTPEDPRMRPYRELAKGMVEYRLGHFDEAEKWLARHAEQTRDKQRRAIALSFLAMSECQRGNLDQAHSALRQASETIASDGPKGDNWRPFRDWIVAVEARRQAEELIGRSAPAAGATQSAAPTQSAASPK